MDQLNEIAEKTRWDANDAEALLSAWREAGGGSLAAFARGLGVGEERLRRWRVKLEGEKRGCGGQSVSFVELRPTQHEPTDAGVDVLVGEFVVRLHAGFDATTLQRAVELLGGPRC